MDSVEGLRSLEEIRQAKYRCLRCADLKLWDEIGDTFTDHHDRYERGADSSWRIANIRYVRTYEAMISLEDLPSFKLIAALGGVPASALCDASGASAPSGAVVSAAHAAHANAVVR